MMTMSSQPHSDAFDTYQSTRFFINLNGLRFICIMMVLWYHAPPTTIPGLALTERGFLGVDFFFVLSGFLITTLLLREEQRSGRVSLRNFWMRRIVRIIPVYFFVVSLVSAYFILLQGRYDYIQLLPFYYLFLSNFLTEHIPTLAPTWSLAAEEQYYLIWPVLLVFLPRRLIVPLLCVLIALNVILVTGLLGPFAYATGVLVFKLPVATYAPILMGSLVAMMLHHRAAFTVLYRIFGHAWASVVWFAGLLLVMQMAPPDLTGLPNLLIHAVMCAILICVVVRAHTPLSFLLTQPILARIGVVSYGIYLYHLLALDVTVRLLTLAGLISPWAIFLGYTALSWLMAEVSFRTLEAYFHRFRPANPPRAQTSD